MRRREGLHRREERLITPDGPTFSLAFSRALGKVIVHVHGDLDACTASQLRDRLVDIIDGQGNRQIVLDLKATTSIDQNGLSVLGRALRRIKRRGGELVLSGPTDDVMRALEAAGLDRVLVVTPEWQHPANGGDRTTLSRPDWGRSG